MKTKIAILCACAIALAAPALRAQVNPVTNALPPVQTSEQFYDTAYQWLTSVDTNKDWSTIDLEVSTGYKQLTGVGAANTLSGQYDFSRANVGLEVQFSGVGSPINGVEGQIGYSLVQDHDVKVDLDLRGGYDGSVAGRSGPVVEPCLFLEKMMTKVTFSRVGVSLPVYFHGRFNSTPTFFVEMGFGHVKG